jgi:hypothetical protein
MYWWRSLSMPFQSQDSSKFFELDISLRPDSGIRSRTSYAAFAKGSIDKTYRRSSIPSFAEKRTKA